MSLYIAFFAFMLGKVVIAANKARRDPNSRIYWRAYIPMGLLVAYLLGMAIWAIVKYH